jgi:O-antigen/teichoic acid export membrane protein
MRLGQTSVLYFIFRLVASLSGFAATLYIARFLGAGPLGVYHLAIGLVSWLAIVSKVGVSSAISKRVSEGNDRDSYAIAGAVIIAVLFAVTSVGVLFFQSHVNTYVGSPNAAVFIIFILFLSIVFSVINSLLNGLHLVHVQGFLSPIKTGSQGIFQITAVAAGLGISGLFLGHLVGAGFAVVIGLYIVSQNISVTDIPRWRHFRGIINFAKFSWLGGLQSRMFNYTDILVLGFFVPSTLIGVYSVAWNIAQFLMLFSGALMSTLFPEISEVSSQESPQAAADLIEQSLVYGGLFLIPGVIGGSILGERILQMYGSEFTQGTLVLTILVIANLFMGYQNQILNALEAIDRPDLSFRVNVVFVLGNLSLNVILIYLYGWTGAAVATTVSVAVSLILAYRYLSMIVDIKTPTVEITRQWFSALVMGGVVYGGLSVENTMTLIGHNFVTVVLLIGAGASVYFVLLLILSSQFRATVGGNLPVNLPYLTQ